MKRETLRRAWEVAASLVLASFYCYFAFLHGMDFAVNGRPSSLMLIVFESFIIFFVLLRAMPREVSLSYYDWALAFAGASLPLLLRPAPGGHEVFALQFLQALGLCVSLAGLFSLNRSFGVVPANRKIKTGGLFAYVRHPIYAGYFLSVACYAAQQPTPQNIAVTVVFIAVSVLRMIAEEQFLARDADYAAYMKKTKWRVLPLVW